MPEDVKIITARMQRDWVQPYANYSDSDIPVVLASTHSRFVVGDRLDWGFVKSALRDGYTITLLPK